MKNFSSRLAAGVVFGACVAGVGAATAAEMAPPLHVYSAGSFSGALKEIAARYTTQTGQTVDIVSGPAGLLRQRIEHGAEADVFVSANLAHPQRLAQERLGSPAVIVARNALCLTARTGLHLTSENLLSTLLKPSVKLGTSTPGFDPGGDYAWAWFKRIDALHPGAGKTLRDKAQQLVGGAVEPTIPGHASAVTYFLQQGRVDAFIGYCSSHKPDASSAHGLMKIALPAAQSFSVDYAMTVRLQPDKPARQIDAYRFANFLMTPAAQGLLRRYGFKPVAALKARDAMPESEMCR